jgi:hypothetical protein
VEWRLRLRLRLRLRRRPEPVEGLRLSEVPTGRAVDLRRSRSRGNKRGEVKAEVKVVE